MQQTLQQMAAQVKQKDEELAATRQAAQQARAALEAGQQQWEAERQLLVDELAAIEEAVQAAAQQQQLLQSMLNSGDVPALGVQSNQGGQGALADSAAAEVAGAEMAAVAVATPAAVVMQAAAAAAEPAADVPEQPEQQEEPMQEQQEQPMRQEGAAGGAADEYQPRSPLASPLVPSPAVAPTERWSAAAFATATVAAAVAAHEAER